MAQTEGQLLWVGRRIGDIVGRGRTPPQVDLK